MQIILNKFKGKTKIYIYIFVIDQLIKYMALFVD